MTAKWIKTIFWGGVISPFVLGVYFLFGGYSVLAAGPHGHGPGGMGPRGGFGGGHHGMHGPHHGGGFSWLGTLLFVIIVAAIVVFLVKWLRKKSKAASMQQFIDTSLIASRTQHVSNNDTILDQWEKNITNKKENE
ncbi:hypothetical protein [Peribacillus sp. SCS-155]|uniref:hypothetical protein n=1 Tax=Peribacillus sedimenti TaxID=3115297 RepID=UPI0039069F16